MACLEVGAWNFINNGNWSLNLVRREANGLADNPSRKAIRDEWSWSSLLAVLFCAR